MFNHSGWIARAWLGDTMTNPVMMLQLPLTVPGAALEAQMWQELRELQRQINLIREPIWIWARHTCWPPSGIVEKTSNFKLTTLLNLA